MTDSSGMCQSLFEGEKRAVAFCLIFSGRVDSSEKTF